MSSIAVRLARYQVSLVYQYHLYLQDPDAYFDHLGDSLAEILRKHRESIAKLLITTVGLTVLGNWIIIHSVESWNVPAWLAKPAWGLLMVPFGYLINRYWVFRAHNAVPAHKKSLRTRLSGTSGRWWFKTTAFALAGHGSYQILVTWWGWNISHVVWGTTAALTTLSTLCNYWVFKPQAAKLEATPNAGVMTDIG